VVTVRQLDIEHGVRQRVLDDALDLDDLFLLFRLSRLLLSFWHWLSSLTR
jgi:hypothetical protein